MTTYDHIQELRAELRNAVYQNERKGILKELAAAERQLADEEAASNAMVFREPPEQGGFFGALLRSATNK
jgi:hypothetical protein